MSCMYTKSIHVHSNTEEFIRVDANTHTHRAMASKEVQEKDQETKDESFCCEQKEEKEFLHHSSAHLQK